MKKRILFLATALVFGLTSASSAAQGMYASGNIGLAIPTDSEVTDSAFAGYTADLEYKSGLAVTGAIGYDTGSNTRFEGEVGYQKNDVDKVSVLGVSMPIPGDATALSFLVNGYYDFANESAFTPYITAGVGFTNNEFDDGFGATDDDTVFAYQVGVGVGYAASEQVTLDLKYRYFGSADMTFDTTEVDFASHNIYVGVRVKF